MSEDEALTPERLRAAREALERMIDRAAEPELYATLRAALVEAGRAPYLLRRLLAAVREARSLQQEMEDAGLYRRAGRPPRDRRALLEDYAVLRGWVTRTDALRGAPDLFAEIAPVDPGDACRIVAEHHAFSSADACAQALREARRWLRDAVAAGDEPDDYLAALWRHFVNEKFTTK